MTPGWIKNFVGLLVLALAASASAAGPCAIELSRCIDHNTTWFTGCKNQANRLAGETASPAQAQRLLALCKRPMNTFENLCQDHAARCTARRVEALKQLTRQSPETGEES